MSRLSQLVASRLGRGGVSGEERVGSNAPCRAPGLLAALQRDGCPICHELEGHDRRHFFWFFNENYAELPALDALTRSLGFCRAHAAVLTGDGCGSYQLAFVHRVLIARVRATLAPMLRPAARTGRSDVTLGRSGLCPPCGSRLESAGHAAFRMAQLVGDPRHADRYGRPGLLCFPHLMTLWVIAEECQSRHLRGYGELGREVSAVVDPLARRLGELMLRMATDVKHGAGSPARGAP